MIAKLLLIGYNNSFIQFTYTLLTLNTFSNYYSVYYGLINRDKKWEYILFSNLNISLNVHFNLVDISDKNLFQFFYLLNNYVVLYTLFHSNLSSLSFFFFKYIQQQLHLWIH